MYKYALIILMLIAGCQYIKPDGIDIQSNPKENTKHKYSIVFIFRILPPQYKEEITDEILIEHKKIQELNFDKEW